MILQDPTLLRSALAAALEAARASDAGQQALPLPPPPEPPPLSPAAARRAAAAARIHQAPRTAPAVTGARASSPRRRSGPRITGDGYYEVSLQDPEGNLLELVA